MKKYLEIIKKHVNDIANPNEREELEIYVVEKGLYVPDTNQSDVDLSKEIRVNCDLSINVRSKDIDAVVNAEEIIKNDFQSLCVLADISSERCLQNATLILDNAKSIERGSNASNGYWSYLPMRCEGIILEKEIVHPSKIELETVIQLEVMKHLAVLNELHNMLEEQNIFTISGNKEQSQKEIEQQINEMYNFENLCQEPISISNNGFKFCCEKMLDKYGMSIRKATELYKQYVEQEKQRIEQEEQRKAEAEEQIRSLKYTYSGQGDKSLNRYLDVLVEDMRKKLEVEFPITIYGGSSEREFYVKDCEEQLEYPCILISNTCLKFDFGKTYENVNLDGCTISHNYSMDVLPLNIEVAIKMYVNDTSHEQLITEKIRELYSSKLQVNVLDNENEDEFIPLNIIAELENAETTTLTSEDDTFVKEISVPFCKACIPYKVKEYDVDEIPKNRMVLVLMMKRAIFYDVCVKQITDALNRLKWDYNDLVHSTAGFVKIKKKESIIDTAFYSTFSTLGHAVGDVLRSKDYKRLREDFTEKRPIDKNLFDSVMKDITCIYPLYEKTMQGWSYEQIKEDLEKYMERIEEYKNQIIQKLELPEKFEKLPTSLGTPNTEIEFLSEYVLVNPKRTLKEAINCRGEFLYQKAVEEAMERERIREENIARQEAGYNTSSSSGSGLLSGVLKTATGVALGNKMSGGGSNKPKKGYFDIDPSSWKYTCPPHCPNYKKCQGSPSTCGRGVRY